MGMGGELKNSDQMATPRQSLADICSCPICMDVFKDAVQLSCCNNHLCRDCLDKSSRVETRQGCPMCRSRNVNSEPAAPSLRLHLRKCRMLCINSTCPENENGILIDNYENHIAQCRHIPVRCEFCDQEFSQLLIPAHQENECTQRWKKTAQNSRNMAEENARLGNEVYHLQMQLSEANELHAREIHQAKEKNCILKREIDYKDSQISQLEEQLEHLKQKQTQHDNLHASVKLMQGQIEQMQHGQIPRQGYLASEQDNLDIEYTINGGSSSDQVFRSRSSISSANSSFMSQSYEKPNPFQTDPITSSPSLSSFDEQQQLSPTLYKQGIPARPAPMSANLSIAPKSRVPKPKPSHKRK